MANRYANLVGSNKIKDEYQKINIGFDKVEQEMDEKPDNSFARINDVEAEGEDAVTIEAGTGITVTTTPEEKKIRITATGEAAPGPHGSEHNYDGSDPIPDLVQLRDDYDALRQKLNSHGHEHNHDGADPIPDLVQLREGVIVESGENANGWYVRFADGTFIAYRKVSRPADELLVEYTAPMRGVSGQEICAFAASQTTSDPARLESAGMLNVRVEGSGWITRLSPNFFVEGTTILLDLILIGRWK